MEITENILPLAVSLRQTGEIQCAGGSGGSLEVETRGGKGPYEYKWSNPGLNGAKASGLKAGEYSLTVIDATGQSQTASLAVAEPLPIEPTANVVAPASTGNADGQASASATGGTPPYSYAWDNGETGATASKLAPGAHSVTITDVAGCTATASVEVTENILPLAVSVKLSREISCFGSKDALLTVEVRGGKGPFQYQWSDPALVGPEIQNTGPGDYSVTITDVVGTTKTAQLSVSEPEQLVVEITDKVPAFSETTNDGKAGAKASGGNGNYSFSWDNGATGAQAEGFSIGQHSVTVTDGKACTASVGFEITERIMKELSGGAVRSGQTIQMQKLQFEADSTNIQASAVPILDEIYVFLRDNPSIVVEIAGHTNNLPPPEYCDQLSTARARAVAEYLVQKGIEPSRVFYKGYGKRDPLFSNGTEDGRRRNQRVEIKILRL